MAGPEILTKDDVPLYELGNATLEMMDVFNEEASQGFVDRFTQEVNSRTFLARTGDVEWDEIAEGEHPTTASLDDYQMAFTVDEFAKSLGFTRQYIEDSPAELVEEHVAEVIAGGRDKMFDITFETLKSGVADGSQLWFDPQDYGAYSFSNTHNHTYTGLNTNAADASRTLFGDAASYTPTQIARELIKELSHHGLNATDIIVDQELADLFIDERTDGFGSQYHVPQAENLVESSFEDGDNVVQVDGATVQQTAWLTPDSNGHSPIYVFDSSQSPVKRHTVRPMEITDNSGAPVGGAGGFRGDPGALLGSYGSMRLGTVFDNPLSGAKVEAIDPADVTTN